MAVRPDVRCAWLDDPSCRHTCTEFRSVYSLGMNDIDAVTRLYQSDPLCAGDDTVRIVTCEKACEELSDWSTAKVASISISSLTLMRGRLSFYLVPRYTGKPPPTSNTGHPDLLCDPGSAIASSHVGPPIAPPLSSWFFFCRKKSLKLQFDLVALFVRLWIAKRKYEKGEENPRQRRLCISQKNRPCLPSNNRSRIL